jgi:hypothetical protein
MVHVAKYLGRKTQDPSAVRAELEEFATLLMPRWKQHARIVRFMPDLMVNPMMPETVKRPDVDFLAAHGHQRVMIAGDWVGSEGLLSDAAISSALRAARMVQNRKAMAA